ncbi:MAG: alpha-mannosidase [Muribaculaceae bacterium]|nr:alpha-mannosidase [Muribaculaceae bacterium]
MTRRICGTLVGLLGLCCSVCAKNFFVDGYHGGIYGHYPVQWKTQFIVDQLNGHPDWYVGLEIEPETWDTVQVRTPEAYSQFAGLLAAGRMEYTNPTYAQPYCYNIMGESIIRQFRYGIEKLRKHFGDIKFNTYAVEEPCFTSGLPAILKGFGFKYASLKCPNTCWGGYMAPYGGQLVEWVGPDGTEIVTVPRYGCEELEQNSVWQTTGWGNSQKYWNACSDSGIENPVAMCYQDAGWRNGPWLGRHRHGTVYRLWTDYIENCTPAISTDRYVMSQDDVRVNLMWGSQVLQRIAREVRQAENNMLMAEKIGAIAHICAGAQPDQTAMDEAWRQLMLAQHHDSWIVPYNGLWHFGTWADAIKLWTSNADAASHDEVKRMAAAVDAGNVLMIKVFNTTLQLREEVVAVDVPDGLLANGSTVEILDKDGSVVPSYLTGDSGRRLVFTARVPSFGYTTYNIKRVAAAAKAGDAVPDKTVLENEHLRVALDLAHGGVIKSLILKDENNREFAPADTSRYSLCELRGFFYDEGRFRSSAETSARVVDYDSDPLVNRITVEGEIAGTPYRLTYSLPAGSRRVDCALTIDWKENRGIGEYREKHWNHDRRAFCDDRYKLCLLLPVSFEAERLWKDAPFDVCESAQESTFFDRWSAIKHNVILDWIDFTDRDRNMGMGLLSDHTTSYVHGPGVPTALTIQYSGQGLWGPDYKITEPTEVAFALVPHSGDGGAEAMCAEADRFNEPLRAVVCGGSGVAASRSLAGVADPGYRLSAASVNHDGNVIFRLHNAFAYSAARVTLDMPCKGVDEVDLLDNRLADVTLTDRSNSGVAMNVTMPRNGFRTYLLSIK